MQLTVNVNLTLCDVPCKIWNGMGDICVKITTNLSEKNRKMTRKGRKKERNTCAETRATLKL
jgi:hypothetical protein